MYDSANILVVDDNPLNLKLVNNLLVEKHYNITLASSGAEALQLIEIHTFDIILLDIMMPEMDGFEVCKTLKGNNNTKDIPIIFLSAKDQTEDIVKGFQIGGVDYITKPFQKEELLARLNNHIELKQARDLLKRFAEQYKDSRNSMMSILLDLGKVIDE